MQVGVIYYGNGDKKIQLLAESLAKGIEANGHTVDVVDASKGVKRKLAVYQYIAFGVSGLGFFGKKLPRGFKEALKDGGELGGKKCFVFTPSRLVGSMNALQSVMKTVESFGMFIKFSEVLKKTAQAEKIGKRLKIQ